MRLTQEVGTTSSSEEDSKRLEGGKSVLTWGEEDKGKQGTVWYG